MLSSDFRFSYAYSTVTLLGESPKTLASIGGIHGKRIGCARAIASFIVVFPDPFAPSIREKRLLNSHDIFACAAARYPSTVIFFRYIAASKLEKILCEDFSCHSIARCDQLVASMIPSGLHFRTTVKFSSPARLDYLSSTYSIHLLSFPSSVIYQNHRTW